MSWPIDFDPGEDGYVYTGRTVRTVPEFKRRFPKFSNASETEIAGALSEATNFVSQGAYRDRWADAVELKAACILELQMYGQENPPPAKGKKTQYQEQFDALSATSPVRMLVL